MSRTSKIAAACGLALAAVGLTGALAQDSQPSVRLSRDLVVAASAFETYTRTAGAIDAGFTGPRAVAEALRVASSHEPRQLQAGMIAYAAMAALQDRAFVGGVERMAADPAEREALARRLIETPGSAADLPGADSAAARARAALTRQIAPLLSDGQRVKQAAYDIQRQAWSKATVADARERLALVKDLAARPMQAGEGDADRLIQAISVQPQPAAFAPASPAVARGLAVAALAIIGRAGDEDDAALRSVLAEPGGAGCLRMAKLNLFQCMAVAGPHYEDVFCMSQHAMLEAGHCLASAAGEDAPSRAPASRLEATAVSFPVAGGPDSQR